MTDRSLIVFPTIYQTIKLFPIYFDVNETVSTENETRIISKRSICVNVLECSSVVVKLRLQDS